MSQRQNWAFLRAGICLNNKIGPFFLRRQQFEYRSWTIFGIHLFENQNWAYFEVPTYSIISIILLRTLLFLNYVCLEETIFKGNFCPFERWEKMKFYKFTFILYLNLIHLFLQGQ